MDDYHDLSRRIGAPTSEEEKAWADGLAARHGYTVAWPVVPRRSGSAPSSFVDAVTAAGEEPMATVAIRALVIESSWRRL